MIRPDVQELVALGPLPDKNAGEDRIQQYEDRLAKVVQPVTDEEARVLCKLFGPDECYGLTWSLLHLIESAPNWPLAECLEEQSNEWICRLRRRAVNAGKIP